MEAKTYKLCDGECGKRVQAHISKDKCHYCEIIKNKILCPGGCDTLVKPHVTKDTCSQCKYIQKFPSVCKCGERIKSEFERCSKCEKYYQLYEKYGNPIVDNVVKLTVKSSYCIEWNEACERNLDFKRKYYFSLLDKTRDNETLFQELYNIDIVSSVEPDIFNDAKTTINSFKFEIVLIGKHKPYADYYLL
jgi:hypothetical protein